VGEAFCGDPAGGSVEVEGLGAAFLGEALVKDGPVTGLFPVDDVEREGDERVEEIVEFVFVAEIGPDLFANGGDGGGVDFAGFVGESAAERGGAGAAFFEAGFVEVGVGVGVEEFVSEDGRGWGVYSQTANCAGLNAAEQFNEAIEVHCFLEDVLHDFVDERVVGNLDVADDGLEAGCGLGEDGGHEVFGAGALDLRGDAFALRHAQELQAAPGGPAPAGFEDGGGDGGLFEELFGGVLGEEVEDVGEGETVLLGEGDVDAVVGGGGLQFEVEAAAEAFAEGEAEGFVDAAAEGGVEDELHAAAVVEETLGDDGGFGGDGSEDGAAGDDVGDELLCAGFAEAALLHEELKAVLDFQMDMWWSYPGLRSETWGTRFRGDS